MFRSSLAGLRAHLRFSLDLRVFVFCESAVACMLNVRLLSVTLLRVQITFISRAKGSTTYESPCGGPQDGPKN